LRGSVRFCGIQSGFVSLTLGLDAYLVVRAILEFILAVPLATLPRFRMAVVEYYQLILAV